MLNPQLTPCRLRGNLTLTRHLRAQPVVSPSPAAVMSATRHVLQLYTSCRTTPPAFACGFRVMQGTRNTQVEAGDLDDR